MALIFEADFEGGKLARSTRVADLEYELELRGDTLSPK